MRAPNGFGTVARLSGNRRRPFIIKKVTGWNDKGHPIYEIIGYAATREEGLIILSEYNRDPSTAIRLVEREKSPQAGSQ